jgi:hypothetical protein
MQLYRLNDEIAQFLTEAAEIKDETGEWPEGAKERLKALKLEFAEKLEQVWCAIKNADAESDAVGAEIKRLFARKKTLDARSEWLKEYAGTELAGSPFQGKIARFSWRSSESVEITDIEAVPMAYCAFEKKPDKALLKSDLKQDLAIPGAVLVTKQNLQVR